jgi:DNA anti-recombination protein RmuC
LKPLMQTVDLFVERLYKVILERIPLVYDTPRIMNLFINDKGDMQSIGVNIPIEDAATSVLTILNDLKQLSTNVMVRTGSTIAPRHQELSEFMGNLYQQTQHPVLLQRALELMPDLPDKERLIDELSLNTQLSGQLNQLSKEYEDLMGDYKNMEQQLLATQKQRSIQEFENTLDSVLHKFRAKVEVFENRLLDTIQSAKKEITYAKAQKGRKTSGRKRSAGRTRK